jgi:hypothetical protein
MLCVIQIMLLLLWARNCCCRLLCLLPVPYEIKGLHTMSINTVGSDVLYTRMSARVSLSAASAPARATTLQVWGEGGCYSVH